MRAASFGSILFLLLWAGGCGNQGPPIPPEDVGIRAKVLRAQQQEKAKQAQTGKPAEPAPVTPQPFATPVPTTEPPPQDDLQLPPYRPVGTR